MKKLVVVYFAINFLLLCFPNLATAAAESSFNKELYQQRRAKLMENMAGGIAIFISAEEHVRNNDVEFPFRQDSDFYYLTGFEEKESAFLLIPGADQEFIMFVRGRNLTHEGVDGKRAGVNGAMEIFGADTAFTIDQLEKKLPRYLYGKETVYYSLNNENFNDKLILMLKSRWGNPPKEIVDPLQFVHEMRLIKDDTEIKLMKRSIEITCDAHIETMKAARPGMFEYELSALIEYVYYKNGCPRVGFPSIVGSGPNSIILHYRDNNRLMKDGEVVLMDIGAEYGYYSADITRTIPVNGIFSEAQKAIYQIVLDAQQAGIDMAAPGVGLNELTGKVAEVIKDGLFQLGLITDKNSNWQYRVWYKHGPCHWLGLDVHDAGDYKRNTARGRILEPGMVFTVEPGIYIGENTLENLPKMAKNFGRFRPISIPMDEVTAFIKAVSPVAKKYINIGVRIEDDVLITPSGHELLSAKAPRSIEDIETMMKEASFVQH